MTYQVLDNGVVRDATPEEAAEIDARKLVDLDALKTEALSAAYSDVDKVTFDAVGNRVEEYKAAETAARAYADAGYTGTVDEYVSSYALHNPTGAEQTNQWAADQIVARADSFRAAQKSMRAQRFESQAAIRAATTPDELEAAVNTWDAFIASTRSQLGL